MQSPEAHRTFLTNYHIRLFIPKYRCVVVSLTYLKHLVWEVSFCVLTVHTRSLYRSDGQTSNISRKYLYHLYHLAKSKIPIFLKSEIFQVRSQIRSQNNVLMDFP